MEMRNLLMDQALISTLNISQSPIHTWRGRTAKDSQNGPPERLLPPPPGGSQRISIHWSYLGAFYKSLILKELADRKLDTLNGRLRWCHEAVGSNSRYILACGCKL